MPLRVLVVDDDAAVRDVIRVVLSFEPGIKIVGEASDGVEAIEEVNRLRPDAVVLDLTMPRMGGAEALPILLRDHPSLRVVTLSAVAEVDPVVAQLSAAVVEKTRFADLLPAVLCGWMDPDDVDDR